MNAAQTQNNQTEQELKKRIGELPEFITSNIFKMKGHHFASMLIFRYAGPWIVTLLITAIIGLIFGIAVDIRWFIVGLMLVFVVFPGILAIFYYSHGLRKECYLNALSHSLTFCEHGITARIVFPATPTSDSGNADISATETSEIQEKEEFFSYEMMSDIRRNIDSSIITLKKPLKGFIWIPENAFEDSEIYSAAILRAGSSIDRITKS